MENNFQQKTIVTDCLHFLNICRVNNIDLTHKKNAKKWNPPTSSDMMMNGSQIIKVKKVIDPFQQLQRSHSHHSSQIIFRKNLNSLSVIKPTQYMDIQQQRKVVSTNLLEISQFANISQLKMVIPTSFDPGYIIKYEEGHTPLLKKMRTSNKNLMMDIQAFAKSDILIQASQKSSPYSNRSLKRTTKLHDINWPQALNHN